MKADEKEIEKELREFAGTNKKRGQNRATLFNLIVFTSQEEKSLKLKALLKHVIERFPCQLIFVNMTKPETDLSIDVSCEVSRNLSCDFVEIKAAKKVIDKIPFFIFPLLISDLPSYLLLGENPSSENTFLSSLTPYVQRIIFNLSSVKEVCQLLSDTSFAQKSWPKFRDVNWTHISGWRKILAQSFDTPNKIEDLFHIRMIHIAYSKNQQDHDLEANIQAHYLHTWLAEKLRWKTVSFSNNEIIYQSESGTVEVHVSSRREDFDNGDILSIVIECEKKRQIQFSRKGPFQVIVHSSNAESCDLPQILPLTTASKGFRFWREIFYEDLSPDYMKTLKKLCSK